MRQQPVYDGPFSGTSVQAAGVTTKLLIAYGTRVFSEDRIEEATAWLAWLEGR